MYLYRTALICLLGLWLGLAGCPSSSPPPGLERLLPPAGILKGVEAAGKPMVYVGPQLFDYMNGGADLYYEYGFEQALVQRYKTPQGGITAEIYQMPSAADAYGIFSTDRTGDHPAIGQAAALKFGLLTFWQDRYFVRLFADKSTAASGLTSLGRAVAATIGTTGPAPAMLAAKSLAAIPADTILYFKGPVALNNVYFLSHDNVLSLQPGVSGITFAYPAAGEEARIIMVQYPDTQAAETAFDRLCAATAFKQAQVAGPVCSGQTRNGHGGARLQADRIALILDAAQAGALATHLNQITGAAT